MSRGSRSISYVDISADEEADLVSRCAAGDRDAAQVLIDAHRNTINVVARRYALGRLTHEEATQAGCLGLLWAARKYVHRPGARFIAYAKTWIKHEAKEAHRLAMLAPPSRRFISDLDRAERSGERLPDGEAAAVALLRLTSLDAPLLDDGGESTLHDVASDGEPSHEEILADADADARRRGLINAAMACLGDQEREVVRRRYLQDEPEEFAAIGAAVGVSRWSARRMSVDALNRLREAVRVAMSPDDVVLFYVDRSKRAA